MLHQPPLSRAAAWVSGSRAPALNSFSR
jgi:hypothetical protein